MARNLESQSVDTLFKIALDEITEEAMQFDPAVVRPSQATAKKGACGHIEIATRLLSHPDKPATKSVLLFCVLIIATKVYRLCNM